MVDVQVRDELAELVELAEILGDGAVRAVYQPIVDLATGRPVAYEALARGPVGSPLERPDRLLAVARRAGRLGELDWACRLAALRGALEAGMTRSVSLFVNVEPDVTHAPPTGRAFAAVREASGVLDVVVEVTERSLVVAPAELLGMVSAVRATGWGIALDDVGAEMASLALMPFLQPDVIKLDLSLVQERPSADVAAIVSAVNAQSERTGALVLAEGIEHHAHLSAARAMGASVGQGWLFGRPGPLPADVGRSGGGGVTVWPVPAAASRSVVAAAAGGRPLSRSTKPLLLEMSWHLERQAAQLGAPGVVLSAFQTDERFTPATRGRYAALARDAAFVGALGVGMDEQPAPGVRGGHLWRDDPLVDEWAVAVVGPHFAAALAAIDLHDRGPDAERRFDYIVTYDRDRVLAVAASLMARIARHPSP